MAPPVVCGRLPRRGPTSSSAPYDLFLTYTHAIPPVCRAPVGVLMVLFPLVSRPYTASRSGGPLRGDPAIVAAAKRLYHAFAWRRRMRGYQIKLANSEFTREWTKRRWAVDPVVLHPPVDVDYSRDAEKTDTILSVGRFATQGHAKRQFDLARAFADLGDAALPGWRYACVGGLGDSPADRAYFDEVRAAALVGRVEVRANLERAALHVLFERSKVFWHAAGLDASDDRPERMEHFGRATVEAMAAGCVPIVFDGGGQREIVRHGVDGFRWRNVAELKAYTVRVARDEGMRVRMAEAARARATLFGREAFVDRFVRVLDECSAWRRALTADRR